jgi:hypothetical protein
MKDGQRERERERERGFKGVDDTRKSFIEYMGEASSNFKQGLNEDETEGGWCR